MRKKQLILKHHKNPKIKVGDKVKIWDGSGLTCPSYNDSIYIVFPYSFTGSRLTLKELIFTVTKTNVKDSASLSSSLGIAYVQDIEIEINGVTFKTCSNFVTKQI